MSDWDIGGTTPGGFGFRDVPLGYTWLERWLPLYLALAAAALLGWLLTR